MTGQDDDYYDDDRWDGHEPSEPDFGAEEHYRYWEMSRFGRLVYDVRDFAWRHTWCWRNKISARWLPMTGRATTESEEPPF